jgi:hypothetical protein
MKSRSKTRYTVQDLANKLNCSYATARNKLIRNGYEKTKNRSGYYSWNEKQFNAVVKDLSRDGT